MVLWHVVGHWVETKSESGRVARVLDAPVCFEEKEAHLRKNRSQHGKNEIKQRENAGSARHMEGPWEDLHVCAFCSCSHILVQSFHHRHDICVMSNMQIYIQRKSFTHQSES